MELGDLLAPEAIMLPLEAENPAAAIAQLATLLARQTGFEVDRVRVALEERERLGSTAIGNRVAVPHARLPVRQTFAALGLAQAGIPFQAPDGLAVHIVFALISPLQGSQHLRALATVAHHLLDKNFCDRLLAAKTTTELHMLCTTKNGALPPARS